MGHENIELRIRHPKGNQVISTLYENSSIADLKVEISKISDIPASKVALKLGYPPQRVDLPDNTTLENIGIVSGETIIAEENQLVNHNTNPVKNSSSEAPKPQYNQPTALGQASKPQYNQPTALGQASNKYKTLKMIRRVIPADNSCLFNSIAYALENKAKNKARELRSIVAGYIMSDPDQYNEVVLERPNDKYCEWIQKDESWGGAIELEILSKHYEVEMCAVDVENIIATVFGTGQNYKKRIYVLYDGIHYDILAKNVSEDADGSSDITVFDPNDKQAYEGALLVAKELNAKKQFTNMGKFTIQCGICYKKFKGENEAIEHNKETGHINFQEVTNS